MSPSTDRQVVNATRDAEFEAAVQELVSRLLRYPADRYPVQHATTRFHLGVVRAGGGAIVQAEVDLRAATELCPSDRMPVEHAKALNALGAVLRDRGRPSEAAECFEA